MVFHIAHTLRRSYIRCFHEFVLPTHLTPCSVYHQLSSIKYLTVNAGQLRSVSTFQVLSNKQSDLLLTPQIPLKSPSSHLQRLFSSRSGQVISKDNSKTDKDKPFAFADSDTCLLLDVSGGLISQLTFAESKAEADKNKCRLVYMHKNKDGLPCFRLQALVNTKAPTASNISERNAIPTKRFQKSAVKEFRIQATVSDHDFSIKLNKMKSLLIKGKQLKVHIASSSETKNGKTASFFIKRLTEELGDICQIKQDFANDRETCLTMTAKETVDKKATE